MRTQHHILLTLIGIVLLGSCSKEITVDLPQTEEKFVIEGHIENDRAPMVLVSRTQNYFEPTDISSLSDVYVSGATVQVSDGTNTLILDEVCSSSLTPAELESAAVQVGLDPFLMFVLDICFYTITDPNTPLVGTVGRSYSLEVQVEGKTLTSRSKLPNPVGLDSVWFQLEDPDENDSLGFSWATLNDPDTAGNFYRWSARRINSYASGQVKDAFFISPLGSIFDDRFITGQAFDFFAFRGTAPFSEKEDDENEEVNRFKVGDTIVVRFLSMNEAEYEFFRTYEANYASAGDLFTTPTNIRTNVDGGLGIWSALGTYYDTIIATP